MNYVFCYCIAQMLVDHGHKFQPYIALHCNSILVSDMISVSIHLMDQVRKKSFDFC